MHEPRPPLLRRLIPWILFGAYALVIVVAVQSVLSSRQAQRAAIVDQLETGLRDQVAAWEDELLATLSSWMEVVGADPERARLVQQQMRRRPWFNAVYLWDTPRRIVGLRKEILGPRVLFPAAEVTESRLAQTRFCMQRARLLASDPRVDPEAVANAFVVGCQHESLEVRMIAASEAATVLRNHGRFSSALAKLSASEVPEGLTLSAAALDGISPFRLATLRIQTAELLALEGREEDALELYERVGVEIGDLDAPDAARLLQYARYPILPSLRRGDHRDAYLRVQEAHGRAERRVAAYRELTERIVDQVPRPASSEAPRFIYDQYSDAPFVLYYGWPGSQGVALQLEQDALIRDFIASKGVSRLRPWLTITDQAGTVLDGARSDDRFAITVPFTRTLSHIRAGLRDGAVDAMSERMRGQSAGQLAIVGFCALLGFAALYVQNRASRQQTALLARQREFTTRVTHELKTPLAGIRVMAENLEAGAFDDPRQVTAMAGRILDETDRLTARVDEVLAAARQREVPEPKPFDPEELLLELVDTWGPRLEAAGVQLLADLAPTAEVIGDPAAVRDAVACLLDNALKYHDPEREDPTVWVEMGQEGRTVRIVVRDNGMGVPEDMRQAIFERFVRVEGNNRGMAGGYGLGLAQVADIARAHGGRAWCEDGDRGGAAFVLELPANDDAPELV